MKSKQLFFANASLILFLSLSTTALAAITRVIVKDDKQCPPVTTTTLCYTEVDKAIAAAVSGDSIEFQPGTYSIGNITFNTSISLYGTEETAKTILSGNTTGAMLTIDGATSSVSIRKLTLVNANASTGILVRNSSLVEIMNNIFQLGNGSTAIWTTASPSTKISNNTFFLITSGIFSDTNTLGGIYNNIFYQNSNSTAITPTTMDLAVIQNNLFFNGTLGPQIVTDSAMSSWQGNINAPDKDPLFVDSGQSDSTKRDLHLKKTSPCISTGNTSQGLNVVGDITKIDMGAYGGPSADTVPFIVSGLTASATATSPYDITASWSANNAYSVTGYKLYYGTASGNYSGNAPVLVTGTTGSIINVPVSTVSLVAPELYEPEPANEQLTVSWSAVSNATSYKIHWGIASTSEHTADSAASPYVISGLTNGQSYLISVSAVAQPAYHLAVTAYDGAASTTPGISHESAYSTDYTVNVGAAQEGPLSNEKTGYPEVIVPYPDLPNKGCFIATAAYGHYSAPQVQILRNFRDRCLLTNAAGTMFVQWYYTHSPRAARFINENPAIKPMVRAALLPLIGAAFVLTRFSPAATLFILLFLLSLFMGYFLYKRNTAHSGGLH